MGHTFFTDALHEDFVTSLALGLGSHGGSEPGEVAATCDRITDGDDASWFEQWCATADRLVAAGDASARGGHAVSARASYLRACLYYAVAYHPLFGGPRADDRLLHAFRQQRSTFDKAVGHMTTDPVLMEIGLDGVTMPAYLFRAGSGRRPLIVATNGYDATIYEMYLAHAVPALQRGYHCLVFDGPGQGAVLYEQGVPIRPDWETVVAPVVDAAAEHEAVDPDRIALVGWSLGGYLSLRAASGEHRLAACVADPGLYSMTSVMAGRLRAAGIPESVIDGFPDIDPTIVARMGSRIHADRSQRWAVEQRGFWVHGVRDLSEYLHAIAAFTLDGVIDGIRCPTLLTMAENDPLAASSPTTYDALTCPKRLIRFSAAEGADMHCEMRNRSLYDQRTFDWLDEVLGA